MPFDVADIADDKMNQTAVDSNQWALKPTDPP
jgi:hypothetical protein